MWTDYTLGNRRAHCSTESGWLSAYLRTFSRTRSTSLDGTWRYSFHGCISPFIMDVILVLQDGVFTNASDIWSFAIILWELFTRRIPFDDLTPMQCGLKVNCHSRPFERESWCSFLDRSRTSSTVTNGCFDIHRQSHSALHAWRSNETSHLRCHLTHYGENPFLIYHSRLHDWFQSLTDRIW